MNRREASKQETHNLILAAARKLLQSRGPDMCTMREIAEAAGVSPASVVVHFKNKTALLETALYEDIEGSISHAVATMPTEGHMLDRLTHIARIMFGFYDNNRELYRVLIRNTVFEPPGESPHLTSQMEDYQTFFANMIETEKQKGNVRPEADAHIAAASLFSLYFGVLMELLRNPEMTVVAALEWLTVIARQHLEGILQRGDAS